MLFAAACSQGTGAPESLGAATCKAQDHGSIRIENAWVREQSNEKAASAAYFRICNATNTPLVLTGVTTPLAAKADFHVTQKNDAGVVSMTPSGPITLESGQEYAFAPGGLHVMLMGLRGPIEKGQSAKLTFSFADGASETVDAEVLSTVEAANLPSPKGKN